jgi:hypothetical protein
MHSFLLFDPHPFSNFTLQKQTMTTTPPLSVYLPRPRSPKITYSNLPTLDDYIPPLARHVVWWLEDADIFLSIKGIVYGLRRIHFTQSPLFRHLLNNLIPTFGTDSKNPIPFDKIHAPSFYEIIYLLHISEMFNTDSQGWLRIFQIAKDWEMPHVARRATRELDKSYFQNHPIHLRRWDITIYRQVQERQRQLRQEWIVNHSDYITVVEESDDEGESTDTEEEIINFYGATEIIGDD